MALLDITGGNNATETSNLKQSVISQTAQTAPQPDAFVSRSVSQKLDADYYTATESGDSGENLSGSGNLNFASLQAQQNELTALSQDRGESADPRDLMLGSLAYGMGAGQAGFMPVAAAAANTSSAGGITTDMSGPAGFAASNVSTTNASTTANAPVFANTSIASDDTTTTMSRIETGNGTTGGNSENGAAGPAGPAGRDGVDGVNGINGLNGSNGTDAGSCCGTCNVDIDIIGPTIIQGPVLGDINFGDINLGDIHLGDLVLGDINLGDITNIIHTVVTIVPPVLGDITDILDDILSPPASGDTDLVVDLGLADVPLLNDTVHVGLDIVESIIGDVDVNLGVDGLLTGNETTVSLDGLALGAPLPDLDITLPTTVEEVVTDPLGAISDVVHGLPETLADVGGILDQLALPLQPPANGDSDLTLGLDLADAPVLGDTVHIGLDVVESVVGDIDVNLDVAGVLTGSETTVSLDALALGTNLPPREIDGRLAPCLIAPHEEDLLPYVLIAHVNNSVVFYDPQTGTLEQLSDSDSRFSLPASTWVFQPFDRQRQGISRFMRQGTGRSWFMALLMRFAPSLRQILLLGFALNIVALAPPLYMMAVYDRVISPADLSSLIPIAAGVMIALMAEFMFRHVRSRGLSWLSARLDTLVGNHIFAHLLDLPPNVGEKISVAAQIARIKTFESIRDLFSGAIFLSFLELPYIILALGLIAWIAGKLAIVPVVMIGAFCALFFFCYRRTRTVIRLAAKASSARQQFTLETFEKLSGIHANGLSSSWQQKYADLSGRDIIGNFHLAWISTVAETLGHALTLLAAVATLTYGVHLVWSGAIGAGALIASMMLVWRVLAPFYSLCAMVARLEQLRHSVQQVNDLTEVETESDTAQTAARLLDIRGDIAFSDVSMHYSAETQTVLRSVNLTIRPGEVLGITGRNGTGKSTVLKLIKGMYRAQSGSIRIDGFDNRQLDPMHLRRHIGYVAQQAEFFNASVIENLRYARPLATETEVRQALALADALHEVDAMTDGLQTQITPGKLPPGLAARLSLARGYLHGGSILLIDELPSSITRGKAGDYLRRFIARARGHRTIVFVSQDQDLLSQAHSVIEIRDGTIHYLTRPLKSAVSTAFTER